MVPDRLGRGRHGKGLEAGGQLGMRNRLGFQCRTLRHPGLRWGWGSHEGDRSQIAQALVLAVGTGLAASPKSRGTKGGRARSSREGGLVFFLPGCALCEEPTCGLYVKAGKKIKRFLEGEGGRE